MTKLHRHDRRELLEAIAFTGEVIQFPPDKTKYPLDVMPDWIIADIAITLNIAHECLDRIIRSRRRPLNPPPLPKRSRQ